jgi:hypothetical protein
VHIGPQQNLASPVPAVVGELADGVRIVAIDTLRPDGRRTVLAGDIRLAFYRPGRHQVPPFRLILRAIASDRGQPLEPEVQWVDVGTTLPPGNPALKDIRDGLPRPPISPLAWIAGAALLAVLVPLARKLSRRPVSAAAHHAAPAVLTPLDRARAELDRLAQQPPGSVDLYYEQVAYVLRRYFVEMAPDATRAHTSRELLAALASRNGNGVWTGTERVLAEADLVKFAGRPRDAAAARAWTSDVRSLIEQWHPVLVSRVTLVILPLLTSHFSLP